MEIRTIGIDLGKTVFHLVGVNARGEVVVRKKCSRLQLLRFTSNLQVCLIGMEACGGSHFLGRALREQGHDVRLMPAQYVKPYVKTNKNDYIDAEAIAEAVTRPTMRFVPIKTDDQLDHSIQARRSLSQQRPNTFAQTNLSFPFLACKTAADHTFRFAGHTPRT
jgi:transposase